MPVNSRVEDILLHWDELRKQGVHLSAEELCRDTPELLGEVARCIVALESVCRVICPEPTPARRAGLDPGPAEPLPEIPGYETLELLGRGGMGVVYKARQLNANGRFVAVKMIRDRAWASPEILARFRREVQSVARLQHAGIVTLYEVGEFQGWPFFTQEFCGGGSLDRQLAGTPRPPAEAAALVERVARAIHVAHLAGVVHRDLKPANVLLSAEGDPKVADFGMAKLLDSGDGPTQTGEALGTPSYMAPEQAQGSRSVGPAVDVYALGAILYECLTGRPPFKGANTFETVQQVLAEEPVPVRRLHPGVHRDLETICLKCLRKESAKRYESAEALADDLGRFLNRRPIRARPVGLLEQGWYLSRRRPALVALTAASSLLLLGLLGGAFWFVAQVAAAVSEKAAAEALAAAEAAEKDAAQRQGVTERYHRLVNSVRTRASRRRPGWTWDCLAEIRAAAQLETRARNDDELRELAVTCLSSIDVRPLEVVAPGFAAFRVAFHPSGKKLALGQALATANFWLSVRVVDVESGKELQNAPFMGGWIIEKGSVLPERTTALAFSPDGQWLVAGTRSGMLFRLDMTGKLPPLTWKGHPDEVLFLAFTADSRSLVSGWIQGLARWDITSPREQLSSLKAPQYIGAMAASAARGELTYCRAGQVYFLDTRTLQPRQGAPQFQRHGRCCAYSPDSRGLAYSWGRRIQIYDRERGQPAQIFRRPYQEYSNDFWSDDLVFSPEGDLLASSTTTDNRVQLWETASGRLAAEVNLTAGESRCAFSPDGRMMAVVAENGTHLFEVRRPAAHAAVGHHVHPLVGLAASRDGKSLACAVELFETGLCEISLLPTAEPARPSTQPASRPLASVAQGQYTRGCLALHPDKRWLVASGDSHLTVLDAERGDVVAQIKAKETSVLTFAPDGRLWGCLGDGIESWDIPSGKPGPRWTNLEGSYVKGRGSLWGLAAGARWLVAAGRDGKAHLIRPSDGRPVAHLPLGDRELPVKSAALSPDEKVAVLGNTGGELWLWPLPGSTPRQLKPGHEAEVSAVAFGGDGLFATGSQDQTVRLWKREKDTAVAWLTIAAPAPVQSLAFARGGKSLLVLLRDERAVRVWHLERLVEQLHELGLSPSGLGGSGAADAG